MALKALHAVLPHYEFWRPATLRSVPKSQVDRLIEELVAQRPGTESLLVDMRELMEIKPDSVWERAIAARVLFRENPVLEPFRLADADLAGALSWCAGMPWYLWKGIQGYRSVSIQHAPVKWLPDNLVIPGDLRLDGCDALEALPSGLEVGGNLYIEECSSLSRVDGPVKVHDSIHAADSPLAAWVFDDRIDLIEFGGSFHHR